MFGILAEWLDDSRDCAVCGAEIGLMMAARLAGGLVQWTGWRWDSDNSGVFSEVRDRWIGMGIAIGMDALLRLQLLERMNEAAG